MNSFVKSSTNRQPMLFLMCAFVMMSNASPAQVVPRLAAAPSSTSAAGIAGTTAAPVAVPSGYVIGEADVLRINVWKQPEISQLSVTVRPDGMVSLPLVGEIRVSGLTPTQIEAVLVTDLKQYVNEPRVTVSVAEVGSKTVYVTGEVQHPGAYPLVGPIDVLQVIAKAGGVTPYAHQRSVFVLRHVNGTSEKIPVNYSKIFHGKSPEQNINLQPGDTVVVP